LDPFVLSFKDHVDNASPRKQAGQPPNHPMEIPEIGCLNERNQLSLLAAPGLLRCPSQNKGTIGRTLEMAIDAHPSHRRQGNSVARMRVSCRWSSAGWRRWADRPGHVGPSCSRRRRLRSRRRPRAQPPPRSRPTLPPRKRRRQRRISKMLPSARARRIVSQASHVSPSLGVLQAVRMPSYGR
jgi:hypothetical protein